MSNGEALKAVRAVGVVPLVTLSKAEDAAPLCRALLSGGLSVVEVTFRAEGAPEAIALIRAEYPEMCVGAGTVTTPEQARQARSAGAMFSVAPGLNPRVLEAANEAGMPFWPGVCTPSEIEHALDLGVRTVKFFPAGALGGANTVKAMLAPYLHLGLEAIPTGGIDEDTAPSYWGLESIAAVGGSWIAPSRLIETGDWEEIARRAAAAVSRYRGLHLTRLSKP